MLRVWLPFWKSLPYASRKPELWEDISDSGATSTYMLQLWESTCLKSYLQRQVCQSCWHDICATILKILSLQGAVQVMGSNLAWNIPWGVRSASLHTIIVSMAASQAMAFVSTQWKEISLRHLTHASLNVPCMNFSVVLRKLSTLPCCKTNISMILYLYRNHSWVSFQGFCEAYNDCYNLPQGSGMWILRINH